MFTIVVLQTPNQILLTIQITYYIIPRVHNIYTKESILLSYTPVERRIVKL